MMSSVSPVYMSSEALAQVLALAVNQALEHATDIARLNLQLTTQVSGGANPEGVGQLIDLYT